MEEISIKEIIEVLLKGKWAIIIVTTVTLIAGSVKYKLTPNQYKSTASILANPITAQTMGAREYVDTLNLPNMDISSYSQQFLNNYTLAKTIDELDMRDAKGEYITYESLKSKVTVDNPKSTNILNIEVTHGDPQMAANIANALGRHFVDYISNIYQTSAGSSASEISKRLEAEEKNLDAESAKLRDYLMISVNMDALRSEINNLILQITSYKTTINDFECEIEIGANTLEQLKQGVDIEERLDLQSQTLQTGVYNSESPTGYIFQFDASNAGTIKKTVLTLKLTDIETELVNNINSLDSYKRKTDELEKRLSDLQALCAEEEYKYNALQRNYDLAESVYQTYNTQYKQALMLETSNLGVTNIKIISEAVAPTNAYKLNFMMTEAVAGCLGLFISVFVVLFVNYWKSSGISLSATVSQSKAM